MPLFSASSCGSCSYTRDFLLKIIWVPFPWVSLSILPICLNILFSYSKHLSLGCSAKSRRDRCISWKSGVNGSAGPRGFRVDSPSPERRIGTLRSYSLSVGVAACGMFILLSSSDQWGIIRSMTGQLRRRPMSPFCGSADSVSPRGYRHSSMAAANAPGMTSFSVVNPIPPRLRGKVVLS